MLQNAKRILLMLLCLVLVVANIPALAFADDAQEVVEAPAVEEPVTPPAETLPADVSESENTYETQNQEAAAPQEEVKTDSNNEIAAAEKKPLPANRNEYIVPQDYSLYNIINRSYTGAPIYISEAFSLLQSELSEAMNVISSSVNCKDVYVLYNHDRELDYRSAAVEVAAVFCAVENLAEADLLASKKLSSQQVNLLRSIYWEMVELAPFCRIETIYSYSPYGNGEIVENKVYHMEIDVSFCSAYEYLTEPTMAQKLILDSLLSNAVRGTMEDLCSGFLSTNVDFIAAAVINALPGNLDETRRNVVVSACSLVGKVPYFWGGKSEVLGWDELWNTPKVVTSSGTTQKGEVLPYGLDCAGLITWAFINGAESTEAVNYIGHGVESQFYNCTLTTVDALQPGDLLFGYGGPGGYGHVGIVVGKNEKGEILVCHCNMSGDGKVRIEPVSMTALHMAAIPENFYNAY